MKKIISNLAETLNLSEKNTSEIIDMTISVIKQRLLLGEIILINDIASFETDKKNEQILIYPDKMIKVLIPPELYPKVTLKSKKTEPRSKQDPYTRDLKTLISIRANLDEQFAQLFMDSLIKEISLSLKSNGTCKLPGLGSFIRKANPKGYFNPKAELSYNNPRVTFIPEKTFQNEINKAFVFFEPTIVNIKKLPEKKHSPKEILEGLEKIVKTIQTYPKNIELTEDKQETSAENSDLKQEEKSAANQAQSSDFISSVGIKEKEDSSTQNELKHETSRHKHGKEELKSKISDILSEAVSIENSDLNYSRDFYNIDITYNIDNLANLPDLKDKDRENKTDIASNEAANGNQVITENTSTTEGDDINKDQKKEHSHFISENTVQDSNVISSEKQEISKKTESALSESNYSEKSTSRQENIPDDAIIENNIDIDAIMSVVSKEEITAKEEAYSESQPQESDNKVASAEHIDDNTERSENSEIIKRFPEKREAASDINHIDIDAIMSTVDSRYKDKPDKDNDNTKKDAQTYSTTSKNSIEDQNSDKDDIKKTTENKNFIEELLKKKEEQDNEAPSIQSEDKNSKSERYRMLIPETEYSEDVVIAKSKKKKFLMIASAITFAVILLFVFAARSCKKETKEVIHVNIESVTKAMDSLSAQASSASKSVIQNDEADNNVNTDKFLTVILAKEGDNLQALSKKYYGNEVFWIYLYDANKELIPDPKKLDPGIRMVIPRPGAFGFDIQSQAAIEAAERKGVAILSGK